jgi:hypothetical protein
MSSVRKRTNSVKRAVRSNRRDVPPRNPPEAYDHHDDVAPEAIEQLRAEADEILSEGEWTTIDGYVGDNKQSSRVG